METTEGHPHLFPEPRLDVGEALLRRGLATACLDISDGLSTDLAHLCRASGVMRRDRSRLRCRSILSHADSGASAALKAALHGGEDYELLFAAPASVLMPTSLAGVPITRIGSLTNRRSGRPMMTLIASNGSRRRVEAPAAGSISPVTRRADEEITTLTLLPSIDSTTKPTS